MRPHALKQTCLAVAQAVIIAVCLSAPASAQSNTTPSPTPTAASEPLQSTILRQMANSAKDILPIIRNEVEGPLLPWLENLSLLVAVLVMIAAFARLWRENAGAGVDLYWWFARLGVIFALLGSGPRIIDGMYETGLHFAEGAEGTRGTVYSSVLFRFYSGQRLAFDRAYQNFTEGMFIVKGNTVTSTGVTPDMGVLLSDETTIPGAIRTLGFLSNNMPALLDGMNVSRGVISFGDLFLTLLSSFLLIAMRLAAPVMIALAIDRNLAQRVTYPYLWGVVVLTLIWPIIALIIKSIAYVGGNVAMALGPKTPFFMFDETTVGIIKNGDHNPVFTVGLAAVIMLIAGLTLWASPYIAYQLSFGGVYETVTQTISGWGNYFRGEAIGGSITKYTEAMGAMIAGRSVERRADIASAGARTQADPASNIQPFRLGNIFGPSSRNPVRIPGNNDPFNLGTKPLVGGDIMTTGANGGIGQGAIPQFRPPLNGILTNQPKNSANPTPTKSTNSN